LPKIPGVNHLDAVRALEKDGQRILTGGIARDAGLSVEQFRDLL
jgi:hypothetical protein